MCSSGSRGFDIQPNAEALEESEFSLPLSPQTWSPNRESTDHQANSFIALRADESDCEHPSSLHLKPVTWESLQEISFPADEHFDVVDGLLVWVPMAHGTTIHQQILTGLVLLIVQLRSWYATSSVDLEVASLNKSSAKLLKCGDSDVNRRAPDVVILRDHSPSSESSSDSKDAPGKEKCVFRTKKRPPYAVIEVTSDSTRRNDITSKWIQYALTGIRFYYIVDLSYYESSKEAYVIVGSLDPFDGAEKCYHGSPKAPLSIWQPPGVSQSELYYKKVYSGKDRVDVGIFKDVSLSPIQLMNPAALKSIFRALKHGSDTYELKRSPFARASPVLDDASSSRPSKAADRLPSAAKKRSSTTTSVAQSITTGSSSSSRSPPLSPNKKRSRREHKKTTQ